MKIKLILASLALATLAACGGGDSNPDLSSPFPPAPPTPPTPVEPIYAKYLGTWVGCVDDVELWTLTFKPTKDGRLHTSYVQEVKNNTNCTGDTVAVFKVNNPIVTTYVGKELSRVYGYPVVNEAKPYEVEEYTFSYAGQVHSLQVSDAITTLEEICVNTKVKPVCWDRDTIGRALYFDDTRYTFIPEVNKFVEVKPSSLEEGDWAVSAVYAKKN